MYPLLMAQSGLFLNLQNSEQLGGHTSFKHPVNYHQQIHEANIRQFYVKSPLRLNLVSFVLFLITVTY